MIFPENHALLPKVYSQAGLLKPHDGSVAKTGGLWSRLIDFPIHFPESGV
jgi:hypothetical protein